MRTRTEVDPRATRVDDRLTRLLAPSSIAVIGASADPAKRGYQIIQSLRDSGFEGPIHAVNPRGGELLGIPVTTDIDGLPDGVDAALIALPGRLVPPALRELAAKDVAGAIVLANGFLEAGDDGAELNDDLSRVIAETGIRVIGPNTSGIFNVGLGANLVGLTGVRKGPISVLTQSGNMWLSLVADDHAFGGPGFQSYVGLGNQADVRYDECVRFFGDDGFTGAIAIHAEGIQDGRAFLVAASETAMKRPIVMLRGGRSAAGRRTALSHTGSIAGSDVVATAVLAQAGVELVERSDELAIVAGALATTAPVVAGRKVAILSDGGGHATLTADSLSAAGIDLAVLSADTQTCLRTILGSSAEVRNPVDVAGATDADPGLFADCVETLMADRQVGLVLIVGLFGGYHRRFDARLEPEENRTATRVLEARRRLGVPLLVQSCYAADDVENHQILRSGGVPVLASIDHAARVVTALTNRGRWLAEEPLRSSLRLADSPRPDADGPAYALDEPSARALLEQAGLSTGRWAFAASADEMIAAVEGFAEPCAVKVVSPDVIHKSDVGGIRLNVASADAAHAWEGIVGSVMGAVPDATICGMIVAPMVPRGVELLIGATRDPIFGPVVAFGSGGTLVEVRRDVSFRAAPFTVAEAHHMIEETRASLMLDGFRDLPRVDRTALARLLVTIGDIVAADPTIAELDLNPAIACDSDIIPVDVRIVRTEQKEARS